ncbi:GNAT family N-acetyltransferase [Dysgonomonas sp. 520]|uniref:GNAT family N-acetyltransferase n=1 Tax=Dysgonomonas sp. 520 TaxID=2302931 RepID=UPI0013D62516|nr:N-acetyltransferase [Dysgonomonas sp. 520]
MELEIIQNVRRNRYEAYCDNKLIGIISYYFLPNFVLALTNTEVRSKYQNNGVGTALAKQVIEFATSNNYKIYPVGKFIKSYIEQKKECYSGLIIEEPPIDHLIQSDLNL